MTKLKTLKDLKKPIGAYLGCKMGLTEVVDFEDLRMSAIKWVKELNENSEKSFCLTCHKGSDEFNNLSCSDKHFSNTLVTSDPYEPHGTEEAVRWIKHFFNITDEDLI